MGNGHDKDIAKADGSPKTSQHSTGARDQSPQFGQDAGNQAVQAALKDTPTIDDYAYRNFAAAPLTASGSSSPDRLAQSGHRPLTADAAIKEFLSRFPFLKPLTDAYKQSITQILDKDVQNYRDLRRVDTVTSRFYLDPSTHPYSLTPEAERLLELRGHEQLSENAKRTQSISPDWIFSLTPTPDPTSPFAESDGHTYLRETWKKFKQQPVYFAMDGWSTPALQIYISDGTFSWEVLSSPRTMEMDDLLSIQIVRNEYMIEQKSGPKRSALDNAIREGISGLAAAEHDADYQSSVDEGAAPGVVPISKWRGKRAGFPAVVDSYTTVVYAEFVEKKRQAYEPMYLEKIGFFLSGLLDATKELNAPDALTASYMRDLTEEQKRDYFWKKVSDFYFINGTVARDTLSLNEDEWKAVHKEAEIRAEKDWGEAPDVLPNKASFNRVAEILQMASKYLDAGDLQACSIYASLALQMEEQVAKSVDRYKTRVTTGAGKMVTTLQHVEAGSHFLLTVMAPFGLAKAGLTGLSLLAGSAAVPAAFTLASSVASGESVGKSSFDALKEFSTGLLIGRLSELMSARFVVRFGLSRPAADILANITASPYGAAGDILFRKMMDPRAPLPSLEDMENEMVKSVTVGSLVTLATHAAASSTALKGPVSDPAAAKAPEAATIPDNKMSGTVKGAGEPTANASEPSKAPDKFTKFNEEWTGEMRTHGLGPVNVLPSQAGPELRFGIFKRGIATPAEAYTAFNEAYARAPNREVGILRNLETGEYLVQVGTKGSVGLPHGLKGHFETVLHSHTNNENVLVYRLPSGRDVVLARDVSARLGRRPVTQFIEYPLPGGGRGRTSYTVQADGKVSVDFVRNRTGKAEHLDFSSVDEFQDYWDSRTRAVEPGTEDYNELMNEAAETLQRLDPDSSDNRMAGRYRPDQDSGPFGYDSGLGAKKTVTPQDLLREQQLKEYMERLEPKRGPDQIPEVQEMLWELSEISEGQPDPLALYLGRERGKARDMQFKEFILPELKKIMPSDSTFGIRDWAELQRVLGLKRLPWKHGGGPDLILINDGKVKPLDLTTRGQNEAEHLAEKQSQADELQDMLGGDWTVERVEHFYHGRGSFNEATVIAQLTPVLKLFGASFPAAVTTTK